MQLSFFGAAQNVTGSKHLIQSNGFRLLLDCGLNQGKRSLAHELNRTMPFDPKSIDAVILSHAHADHCGMLPILVKQGFRGHIYCTNATAEIAKYILLDSAAIQEQDQTYLLEHTRADAPLPLPPLYTTADVEQTLTYFHPVQYFRLSKQWTSLAPGIRFKLYDAGHILGSAIVYVEITEDGKTTGVGFTGDIGKPGAPILHDPEYIIEPVQTLLSEATYGDKDHRPLSDAAIQLKEVINHAVAHKSKIIVPAFALGRTQELVYLLHELTDRGEVPMIPIFVDSPLGLNISEAFLRHAEDFNDQTWKDFGSKHEIPLAFKNLRYIHTIEESKRLNVTPGPMMIIASSGMIEGGRILHHIKNNISNPDTIVLITGYQAEETLGRKIQDGQTPVKILNEIVSVAAKIITLDEFSAHADQTSLMEYYSHLHELKRIFLVHTETPQATGLQEKITHQMPGIDVVIPTLGEEFTI